MSKRKGKRELIPPDMAARSGGKRILPLRTRPFGILDGALILLCGALVLLIFAAALLPRLLDYTPYAISSDSMAPILNRGDLIFTRPASFDSLAPGDIVVFDTETGPVTHRVYSVDEAARTLRTKADGSSYLDPVPVEECQLLGRAVYKLPLLGHMSLFLGGKEGAT